MNHCNYSTRTDFLLKIYAIDNSSFSKLNYNIPFSKQKGRKLINVNAHSNTLGGAHDFGGHFTRLIRVRLRVVAW